MQSFNLFKFTVFTIIYNAAHPPLDLYLQQFL